jgi:hypothetical protein
MRMLATPPRRGPGLALAAGLALLPVAVDATAQAAPATLQFEEGVAHRPGSRVELYREQHWLRRAGTQALERLVLYRCPDGTAFGRKRVDYRSSATAPEFVFEDRRSGYREGLRRGATTELFYRATTHSPELRASERPAPLAAGAAESVADAGFDEFVRRHWSALLAGHSVPLRFALPSRLRSMGFSLQRAGQATVAGERAWIFRLKLDGWLGLVAPRIDVSYGQISRRLLRFEGLSNLRDDAGDKPLLARIDFATPARPATEAQWQAAAQAPLSACRAGR